MSAIETVTEGLETTGTFAGFEDTDLISLIPGAINVLLGMMGILVFAYFIYAGILYLTSRGNKDTVDKAKKIMQYTIIGLLVIIAAYAIVNYVLGAIEKII